MTTANRQTVMSNETVADIKARLLTEANEAHAQHPQYAGYWDNWVVARATRKIVQRGATCALKGDHVLLDPASIKLFGADDPFDLIVNPKNEGKVFCTVYLARSIGGCNTSRLASDFEVVG